MMPPLSEATRPLMWNISIVWLMYVLFAAAVAVFAWGTYKRIQFWRRGKEDKERFADWGKRFIILLREIFLQKQVRNSGFPAILHCFIFYSFVVLFVTTLIIMVQYDMNHLFGLNLSIFQGFVYVFFSVASELAGILILIGVGMALYRRKISKPETLPHTGENSYVLLLIAAMVVTGYLVEGLRIAFLGDPWSPLSFLGMGIAKLFDGTGYDTGTTLHASFWWLHTVLALGWIAVIPYTKFVHLLSLPTNVFFSKLNPRGELRRDDIEKLMESAEDEEDFQLGIQKADEFTWKQRLDLDACVSCGRCDEVCPAYMADKEYFSARQLIARLKDSLDDFEAAKKANPESPPEISDVVGKVFDEEFIWHCRTCSACMEVCPALIEHVDTLMELRRNEVLIQGRIPEEAGQAMKLFETNGNPFGPQSQRADWIREMGVRVVAAGEKVDVLYWVGCIIAFDPQKHKIARDLCRLMEECGIDFGVLGADEKCCGDPARVMGQEMLFQMAAQEQVELLKQREFKVLLTGCPHCYNTLKHEYRQFGGNFNVVHHSEFIQEMIRLKGLKPKQGAARKAVFHDPCYLGRYQKIYDAPREVARAVPGIDLLEMKNRRTKSLCCGAGGGHYFMDLKRGERINNLRVKQARAAGADTIVTGCAFCLHMLQDSVKLLDYDESMNVIDIASLVADSLEKK
ncbi:MAG: 4Fe-4S dicluster domain-containing protein [Acidobacteria bacterium]|nr:4Fe-4S dicluster domain-containing protein [Acidobacteriota bacterium]